MNDFEDRLGTALRSAGDGAPDATGLAPAARGRARARTRRTTLTSAAAVVAVVGVVGGAALLGNRDSGREATPSASETTATDPSGPNTAVANARVESWRDVSVQVPVDYGYGNLSTWCLNGKSEPGQAVVERPGGAVEAIGCIGPQDGYGVRFFDGSTIDLVYPPGHVWQYAWEGEKQVKVYPKNAWLGYQASATNMVWVVAEDRATVEQILDSFSANPDRDPNGCATQGGEGAGVEPGTVRLCRYSVDGWLEQSEVLTGQNAADALAALESAPERDPDRMCTMELAGPIVQITSADAEGSLTLNACQGFTWDGVAHELTADAIYWAMSPGWSGGVDGDVPMPKQPRR